MSSEPNSRAADPGSDAPDASGIRDRAITIWSLPRRIALRLEDAALRRVGWGVIDQALSSATNFALGVIVARVVSPAEFGAFSVGILVYVVVLMSSRAATSEVFAVRFSYVAEADQRSASAHCLGFNALIGVTSAIIVLVVGLALGGVAGNVLIALAPLLPGLALQDAYRYILVSIGQPHRAAANDLAWAVTQLVAVAAVLGLGQPRAWSLVIAWGLAGNAAAIFGFVQTRLLPHPVHGRSWFKRNQDLAARYVLERGVLQISGQTVFFVLGGIAGLAALGTLRGAFLLINPLNVAFLAAPMVIVPELVRVRNAPERFRRRVRVVALIFASLGALWSACLIVFGDLVGPAVLGELWADVRPLLPPMAVAMVTRGISTAFYSGIRALEAAREGLRSRIIAAGTSLAAGTAGAALGDALGAALGLASAGIVAVAVFGVTYEMARRQYASTIHS